MQISKQQWNSEILISRFDYCSGASCGQNILDEQDQNRAWYPVFFIMTDPT